MIGTLYDGDPGHDGAEITAARRPIELVQHGLDVELAAPGYAVETFTRATHWAILSPAGGVLLFYWQLLAIATPGDTVTVDPGFVVLSPQ